MALSATERFMLAIMPPTAPEAALLVLICEAVLAAPAAAPPP
jgi:hypothetical protein